MNHGTKLLCADGAQRLCVPVLCEYIADMEEQWLLTNLVRQTCPKCSHRHDTDTTNDRPPVERGVQSIQSQLQTNGQLESNQNRRYVRTDKESRQLRNAYWTDTDDVELSELLRSRGYHPEFPFSHRYRFGGILDAVGPDLLHQISKCFMDYLFRRWIHPLMYIAAAKKDCTKAQIDTELDSRFALMPLYPDLRRFRNGILTEDHGWTVHEYKNMMKVIVGALVGICPPEGIALVREYLHIHCLTRYNTHTEESLDWLASAIKTFWRLLRSPKGPFILHNLVDLDYEPQRLHYMFEYIMAIRQKGALLAMSTDLTEIWHIPLKRAWEMSNKGRDAMRYVLQNQTEKAAFQSMVDQVDAMDEDPDSNDPTEATEDNEEATEDNEEEGPVHVKDSQIGRRTYTWPKQSRKGWPCRASTTEKKLNLDGFQASVRRHYQDNGSRNAASGPSNSTQRHPIGTDEFDPVISVYDTIRVIYPSWVPTEIGAARDPAAQVPHPEFTPPSVDAMPVNRIRSGPVGAKGQRLDCVLVNCPQREARGNTNTMSGRRVAQVLLLFKSHSWRNGSEPGAFAYVSWFETKRTAGVNSGLYLVSRTTKRSVIEVTDIERLVHLIPKFGNEVGSTESVNKELESARKKYEWEQQQASNRRTKRADEEAERAIMKLPIMDALSYYKEFWLNSWIDPHLYNTIF